MKKRLKKHLPDYNKGIDFKKITKEHIHQAIQRAKVRDKPLCSDWARDLGGTTVYKLVENILHASKG
jgi:hypothetical protein